MQVVKSGLGRTPIVLSTLAVLVTAAVAFLGGHQAGSTVTFLPAVLSVVACFDVLSVYLLVGEFRDTGDRRILAMSIAYLWSLVLMAGYALAFPGVVAADPPLASAASVAPWLYVCWHAGFPVLLGAAWAPWPRRAGGGVTPARRRAAVSRLTGVVTVAAGAALVSALVLRGGRLPVIIHGRDTSRMTELTAPVTLPLVALAVASCFVGTRRRSGPETWTAVTVLVCLCDLVMTYSTHTRFSVGWYSGRAMTVLAAGVVLFAMLSGFRRLKSEAELAAAYDSLTGLANRRAVLESLDRSYAAARRSGATLSLASLDLDKFKVVNDTHGHAAGDQLLAAVGSVLADAVRAGDLVGRVGGEEFLAVLPDTDLDGARVVAERMRRAVAGLRIAGVDSAFSASVGVTTLHGVDDVVTDLLRRADQALYRAKTSGRDRVVVAAPGSLPPDEEPAAPRAAAVAAAT